jgi:hypothetical protein
MKKIYKIVGTGLVICILCFYVYYTLPRAVNLSYEGIKYTVGNLQQQEQITMNIKGFYYNKLLTKDYFKGSITIEDETYSRLKLLVGEQLQLISYRDYEGDGAIHCYGEIFIDKKLENLTICKQTGKDDWNSENGIMVSAPAKNRAEALEISNKLMRNVLKYRLE